MLHSIDLPSGDGNLDALKEYRLTLSADGKTLYAANAALGVVTEVALDAEISTYPPYQVVRTTHFTPSEMGIGNPSLFTHSAFSPDGKTLYFTSANKAWAYRHACTSGHTFASRRRAIWHHGQC